MNAGFGNSRSCQCDSTSFTKSVRSCFTAYSITLRFARIDSRPLRCPWSSSAVNSGRLRGRRRIASISGVVPLLSWISSRAPGSGVDAISTCTSGKRISLSVSGSASASCSAVALLNLLRGRMGSWPPRFDCNSATTAPRCTPSESVIAECSVRYRDSRSNPKLLPVACRCRSLLLLFVLVPFRGGIPRVLLASAGVPYGAPSAGVLPLSRGVVPAWLLPFRLCRGRTCWPPGPSDGDSVEP
mmetsp:Transcript_17948/g.55762  ORF Transcript_17948/g.55762 Transcript_17948/m.55762 type:complete len:242 (-) Transcript_17948:1066-1791(-)